MLLNIKDVMDSKGISMYKMSKDTGIAQSTLPRMYNQQTTRIDFDTLGKICKYLNCEPSDIFSDKGDAE